MADQSSKKKQAAQLSRGKTTRSSLLSTSTESLTNLSRVPPKKRFCSYNNEPSATESPATAATSSRESGSSSAAIENQPAAPPPSTSNTTSTSTSTKSPRAIKRYFLRSTSTSDCTEAKRLASTSAIATKTTATVTAAASASAVRSNSSTVNTSAGQSQSAQPPQQSSRNRRPKVRHSVASGAAQEPQADRPSSLVRFSSEESLESLAGPSSLQRTTVYLRRSTRNKNKPSKSEQKSKKIKSGPGTAVATTAAAAVTLSSGPALTTATVTATATVTSFASSAATSTVTTGSCKSKQIGSGARDRSHDLSSVAASGESGQVAVGTSAAGSLSSSSSSSAAAAVASTSSANATATSATSWNRLNHWKKTNAIIAAIVSSKSASGGAVPQATASGSSGLQGSTSSATAGPSSSMAIGHHDMDSAAAVAAAAAALNNLSMPIIVESATASTSTATSAGTSAASSHVAGPSGLSRAAASSAAPIASTSGTSARQSSSSSATTATTSAGAAGLEPSTVLLIDSESDDNEVGRLQAILESRGLSSHLLGALGPKMQHILHRTIGSNSVTHKVNALLDKLQAGVDEYQQLQSVMEICQMLVMGNEDTLAGFPIKQTVPALIRLLESEHNFDLMHHACRALTYMMESLPRSSHQIAEAVPIFLQKLEFIQCMDVAEQSLTALDMLSKRHSKSILLAKGVSSCLMYLDFFSINAQRTALSIASNCCHYVRGEEFAMVADSLPMLATRLADHDKRSVESICLLFSYLVESFQADLQRLREIVSDELLKNLQQLLVATPSILSTNVFITVLRMLSVVCGNCPAITMKLLAQEISRTLLVLLVGSQNAAVLNVSSSALLMDVQSPETSKTDESNADDSMRNRSGTGVELVAHSPQELYEITSLIGELMPRLPTDDIFSIDCVLERAPNAANSTTVVWQWRDERGHWNNYSSFDSKIIETAHRIGEEDISISFSNRIYVIDFSKMSQTNEDTGTVKNVRRHLVPASGGAGGGSSSSTSTPSTSATSSRNQLPAATDAQLPATSAEPASTSSRNTTASEQAIDLSGVSASASEGYDNGAAALYNEDRELISSFIQSLFSVLYEVYSSSAGPAVRFKCLKALLRMVYYADAKLLRAVMRTKVVSDHIAGMLGSNDIRIVVGALQMAHILMRKLPEIYSVHFKREGVFYQITKLTETTVSRAAPQPQPQLQQQLVMAEQMIVSQQPTSPESATSSGGASASSQPQVRLSDVLKRKRPSKKSSSSTTTTSSSSSSSSSSNRARYRPAISLQLRAELAANESRLGLIRRPFPGSVAAATSSATASEAAPPSQSVATTAASDDAALGPGSSDAIVSSRPDIMVAHSSSASTSGSSSITHAPVLLTPSSSSTAVNFFRGLKNVRSSSTAMSLMAPLTRWGRNDRFYPTSAASTSASAAASASTTAATSVAGTSSSASTSSAAAAAATLMSCFSSSSNRSSSSSSSGHHHHHHHHHQQQRSSSGGSGSRTSAGTAVPGSSASTMTTPTTPSSTGSSTLSHDLFSQTISASCREKARAWIHEQSVQFCNMYIVKSDEDLSSDSSGKLLKEFQEANVKLLSASETATATEDSLAALRELCRIFIEADVTPFEMKHVGFVGTMLRYLTQNEQNLRNFLHVFSQLPLCGQGSKKATNLYGFDMMSVRSDGFSALVLKLNACVSQLEQFPVRVHDLPTGSGPAGSSRNNTSALRFFNTHQIKCYLQRHPQCTNLKQWKGGTVKIDPLALVQAIERYLVLRGYGRAREKDTVDSEEDSEDDLDSDNLAGSAGGHSSSATGQSSSTAASASSSSSSGSRHKLQFLIGDHILPYNMTVYQAIRQFSHLATHTTTATGTATTSSSSSSSSGGSGSSSSDAGTSSGHQSQRHQRQYPYMFNEAPEAEVDSEAPLGNASVWVQTHLIYYRPVPESAVTPPSLPAASSRSSASSVSSLSVLASTSSLRAHASCPTETSAAGSGTSSAVINDPQSTATAGPTTAGGHNSNSAPSTSYSLRKSKSLTTSKKQDLLWSEGIAPVPQSPLTSYLKRSLTDLIHVQDQSIEVMTLLRLLYGLNRYWYNLYCSPFHQPLLPFSEFLNSKLTAKANRQLQDPLAIMTGNLPTWLTQIGNHCQFLFPFETRQLLFYMCTFDRDRALQRLLDTMPDLNAADSQDRVMPRIERTKRTISRRDILKQAEAIMQDLATSRAMIEIQYDEEVGTGLGPTLEFYALVSQELQKCDFELWNRTSVEHSALYPIPLARHTKSSHLSKIKSKYRFLGKLMAKALMDSRLLDLPLSNTFYKWMLGMEQTLDMTDLHDVVPDVQKTLIRFEEIVTRKQQIESDNSLTSDIKGERVAALDSFDNCSIEDLSLEFVLPGYQNFDLYRNSRTQAVTVHNLHKYNSLVTHWMLRDGVQKQFEALREGFNSVFPLQQLSFFYPEELNAVFCGNVSAWDVKMLTECCRPDHGYTMESRAIRFLFEVLSNYNAFEQRQFLQFLTGSPRLPVGGFKSLSPQLTVVRKAFEPDINPNDYLPSVMTCVNYLKLPDYSSVEVMREKLNVAINEGQRSFYLS